MTTKAQNIKYHKTWKEKHPTGIRDGRLYSRYGLSPDGYNLLMEVQGGVCAICEKPELDGKRLHVDHAHRTGRVRGLLCGLCNRGIGSLKDDTMLVERALLYLKRFTR